MARVYEALTATYESAKVEYAEGEDLDHIGDARGIPRPKAQAASCLVTFTLTEPLEEDITIDEGLIISTEDEETEYITVEALYLAAGELEKTVQCMSVETGLDVKVMENTLIHIVSEIDYDLTCNNLNPSSGGREEYTDDEYRYLLMNWIKVHLKGSEEAYLNYFANLDGIDDYKLVPNWDGSGTMKIILDPGTPTLLNKVYSEVKGSVCQADEIITMSAPSEKSIDIYAEVNVDIDQINPYNEVEKTDIQSRIIQAITIFIEGGYMNDGEYYPGLNLGEDFIPHKLAVFLDDEIPELKNISFSEPSGYIEILDDEIGIAGNLTIRMV